MAETFSPAWQARRLQRPFSERSLSAPPSVLPDISPTWGGDRQLRLQRLFCNVEDWRKWSRQPISPLVGEMSGRTEGGAKDRYGALLF